MNELIEEFLKLGFPIIKIRFPNKINGIQLPNGGLKTKSNFKRAIVINQNLMFKMSDINDQNNAMRILLNIVCRTFWITNEEAIPTIKKHLHIK